MKTNAALKQEVETSFTPAADSDRDDLALVRQIASSQARRLPSHVEYDELVALGNLGMVEARRRYDASRGVPFAAFAAPRIRGAILDGLRHEDPLTREERARCRRDPRMTPSVQLVPDADVDHEDSVERADDTLGHRQERAALRRAIDGLPERERRVVERHFFDELPLRAIGEELGVTESRVCQIVGAALGRLRLVLGVEGLRT